MIVIRDDTLLTRYSVWFPKYVVAVSSRSVIRNILTMRGSGPSLTTLLFDSAMKWKINCLIIVTNSEVNIDAKNTPISNSLKTRI